MKTIKPYVFNGVECLDLNSLAEEYIKDFFNGMEDIFNNAKELLAFVKRCRKDKEFTLEIANYLYSSKYKNNALTFIIFAFTGYGRVVINGEEMTFMGFVEAFGANKAPGNALYAFLEDGGISKTFAILEKNEKLKRDALAIENSFDHEFTRSFLESYYSDNSLERYKTKLDNIIIGNEECFRKATKICKDIEFQLAIAHKIGFKEAMDLHNEVNPVFEAVKILKATNDFDDDSLIKIIEDTFYWWLLDNFEKYQPKSKEAKDLFKRMTNSSKECKKYKDLIDSKKIYDLSVDKLADLSKQLYLYYLDFVTLFRRDQIVLKKKFNYEYVFKERYCNTYITEAFMVGRVVKTKNRNEEAEGRRVNILTGEEIDKDLLDEYDLPEEAAKDEDTKLVSEPEGIDLKRLRRKLNKTSRFIGFVVFELILLWVLMGLSIGLEAAKIIPSFGFDKLYKDTSLLGATVVSSLVLIALLAILGFKNSRAINSEINLEFIENANSEVKLNAEQDKKRNELLKRQDKDRKCALGANRILTGIICMVMAILASIGTLFLAIVLAHYPELKIDVVEKLGGTTPLIGLGAAAGAGLLLGLVKKYKGMLWIILISILSVVAMLGILMYV